MVGKSTTVTAPLRLNKRASASGLNPITTWSSQMVTGTDLMPRANSSSLEAWSCSTSPLTYTIPCDERNSFVRPQVNQPGRKYQYLGQVRKADGRLRGMNTA